MTEEQLEYLHTLLDKKMWALNKKQKRASLDDAYLFGEITLSDYARESQNLDTKYYQIKNDNKINKEYKNEKRT